MSGLVVTVLKSLADVMPLESEWRALFARNGEGLPFATFEWTVAWWTHLARRTRLLRDSLAVFVVRDPDGALVGVAPMMVTSRPGFAVPLLRILHAIGTDPNITEIRGMLVAPEREADVVAAVARYAEAHVDYDVARWCGLRSAERTTERLRAVRPTVPVGVVSAFLLAMPATWDDFKRALPRNIRESLRKCYNSLGRDGHEWQLRVVVSPEEVEAAVVRLIDLHGRRAERTDTIRHRNCFDTAAAARFAVDVSVRLAHLGVVRVFELQVAGAVVAARLGFVFGDRMYLYYSGYDPSWGRYSVMTTTVAEALKYAIASGIGTVNLSTGADESKLRWRPREVHYVDVAAPAAGIRGRLAKRLLVDRAGTRVLRSAPRPARPLASVPAPAMSSVPTARAVEAR